MQDIKIFSREDRKICSGLHKIGNQNNLIDSINIISTKEDLDTLHKQFDIYTIQDYNTFRKSKEL